MIGVRDARRWLWVVGAGALFGCGGSGGAPTAPAQPFQGVEIRAGVVGDQALRETVSSALRGEWETTRGARLAIGPATGDLKDLGKFDLLIFPGDRLGDLVNARALAAIPEKSVLPPPPEEPSDAPRDPAEPTAADPLQFNDVLPAYRDQVALYGNDRMALPYGGSALLLAYNRAAFERPENRAAAEKAKIKLEPPRTWGEFDALARFCHGRDWNGDGVPDQGVALALGPDAEGVGDALFLARAASLGQHRDQYSFLFDADSMKPRIDSPPFVEALAGLAALKAFGPPGGARFNAAAARAAFLKGNVAFLIDRAECSGRWGKGKATGVAPLPGSERVFDPSRGAWENASPLNRPSYLPFGGGWLVGIGRQTDGRRREAALDFAKYLIGPEASSRIRADPSFPMLPVRSAQLGQGLLDPRSAPGVDSRQWADAVSRTLAALRIIPGLRIPEADGYLNDLATGRAAAMEDKPPQDALKAVADAWTARTARLGTERQLWHYRRSLNSLATTPEPPG